MSLFNVSFYDFICYLIAECTLSYMPKAWGTSFTFKFP